MKTLSNQIINMEKEAIEIKISAHIYAKGKGKDGTLHDHRSIIINTSRGEALKKLDEICEDLEVSFET